LRAAAQIQTGAVNLTLRAKDLRLVLVPDAAPDTVPDTVPDARREEEEETAEKGEETADADADADAAKGDAAGDDDADADAVDESKDEGMDEASDEGGLLEEEEMGGDGGGGDGGGGDGTRASLAPTAAPMDCSPGGKAMGKATGKAMGKAGWWLAAQKDADADPHDDPLLLLRCAGPRRPDSKFGGTTGRPRLPPSPAPDDEGGGGGGAHGGASGGANGAAPSPPLGRRKSSDDGSGDDDGSDDEYREDDEGGSNGNGSNGSNGVMARPKRIRTKSSAAAAAVAGGAAAAIGKSPRTHWGALQGAAMGAAGGGMKPPGPRGKGGGRGRGGRGGAGRGGGAAGAAAGEGSAANAAGDQQQQQQQQQQRQQQLQGGGAPDQGTFKVKAILRRRVRKATVAGHRGWRVGGSVEEFLVSWDGFGPEVHLARVAQARCPACLLGLADALAHAFLGCDVATRPCRLLTDDASQAMSQATGHNARTRPERAPPCLAGGSGPRNPLQDPHQSLARCAT